MIKKVREFPQFKIGGRYANRKGEYEVLNITGDKMLVRYDNCIEQEVLVQIQARIANNMAIEASIAAPYPQSLQNRNDLYFFTLGFLSSRATMLEAIIPPHALSGFADDYLRVKGSRPVEGQSGFYVHKLGVDKWGCELRITFNAILKELSNLDFGPDVHVVDDSPKTEASWRINNNGFWWKLLKLGFKMGATQDINAIRTSIPLQHRNQFDSGFRASG